MPRRTRPRKIVEPPAFRGFKPFGHYGEGTVEEVDLLYEEYEAIKLADYDGMAHHDACVLMGVSRPTFARIYESARRKVARALVEVKIIKSVYGNVSLDKSWLKCSQCNNLFTLPSTETLHQCPLCQSKEFENINKL